MSLIFKYNYLSIFKLFIFIYIFRSLHCCLFRNESSSLQNHYKKPYDLCNYRFRHCNDNVNNV